MIGEYNIESVRMFYKWRLVRDFVNGEEDVKNAGELYLPRKGGQSDCSYEAYKARAKVGDYTGQALSMLHGQIFRRTPVIDIPDNPELKKVIKNFNREGDSLYQFASDTAMDNMQTLWGGLLVDMPVADNVQSTYEAEQAGIRPYAKYYPAESVIDWDYTDMNGVRQLSAVILREFVEDSDFSDYSHHIVEQHRILELDKDGFYRVCLFRESAKKNENDEKKHFVLVGKPTYIWIRGERIRYIPFEFLMGKKPEKSMLYGTAELHKHYYMQSADYENGVHYTTIATGCSTGHTMGRNEDGTPEVIKLGEDAWLNFPEEQAKVYTLVFSGDGLSHCETAIDKTKEEIGILGTRMISPDKAMSETKDAAQIHRQGENSKLATYSRNLSEKFTKILQIMADWLGVKEKCRVEFNVDFDSVAFDPNALNAIANLSREGKYPLPLIFEALKKGEYLPSDMDFREFGILVSLEGNGATVEEVMEAYQKIRSGEKFKLPDGASVKQLNAERAENEKLPEETKQV